MRGAERPAKVAWTRPCLSPLQPLDAAAARATFLAIVDEQLDDNIEQLLALTDNLPLAISLIANVASYEGCDTTLARWQSERTRLLSDGYDKSSSLELSISL